MVYKFSKRYERWELFVQLILCDVSHKYKTNYENSLPGVQV